MTTAPADGDAAERLHQAIQCAARAATDWEGKGLQDAPILLAVATPKMGLMIRAEQWVLPTEGDYDRDNLLGILVEAVERQPTDDQCCNVIVAAVAVLLGVEGVRAWLDDAREIRGRGAIPVLMFCMGSLQHVLVTSVAVPKPTLH